MIENKKKYDKEDPMERVSVYLDVPDEEAHLRAMAVTFVEEYFMMGWSDEDVFHLFETPFYGGTHQIFKSEGKDYVLNIMKEVRDGQS